MNENIQLWPNQIQEIRYLSTEDNSEQPALFYAPDTSQAAPLLVALHQWSGDYLEVESIPFATWCLNKGWAFIHPHFRGACNRPEATGSPLVIQDILDAVAYARKEAVIDPGRIYLIGASGGGYTALLVAGKEPDIWAGISVWVPITNLEDWFHESQGIKYAEHIALSCGGAPDESGKVAREYYNRSPINFLANTMQTPIDINAGIYDGHTGAVPISHSLRAFNVLALSEDAISDDEIEFFVEKAQVPPSLKGTYTDDLYGEKKVLFRRNSQNVRITIFNGGHDMIYIAALDWLAQQVKLF